MRAVTVVPALGALVTFTSPPRALARSRIPRIPKDRRPLRAAAAVLGLGAAWTVKILTDRERPAA